MRVPEVNASWTDTAILRHRHADIGVAVALDFGLDHADRLPRRREGPGRDFDEVKSLAERARDEKAEAAGV